MENKLSPLIEKTKAVPSGSGWYSCLCPFHDDHNPSMAFNEEHYVCFACGTIGPIDELITRLTALEDKHSPDHQDHERNHDITTLPVAAA